MSFLSFLQFTLPFINFGEATTTIFSDGFESGDFSKWTGTSGSPTVQSIVKNSGTYAMECAFTGGYASIGCYEEWGTAYSTVFSRFYFQLSAVGGTYVGILWGLQTPGYSTLFDLYVNSGGLLLSAPLQSVNDYYSTTINANTWYCVEVEFVSASSGGGYRVYLNGNLVIDDLNYNTASYTWYRAAYGWYDNSVTFNSFIDDVVVDSSYIGPEVSGLNQNYTFPSTATWSGGLNPNRENTFTLTSTGTWLSLLASAKETLFSPFTSVSTWLSLYNYGGRESLFQSISAATWTSLMKNNHENLLGFISTPSWFSLFNETNAFVYVNFAVSYLFQSSPVASSYFNATRTYITTGWGAGSSILWLGIGLVVGLILMFGVVYPRIVRKH